MTQTFRFLLFLFLLSSEIVNAQSLLIGSVLDKEDNTAMIGVNIKVTSFRDSTRTMGGITDNSGNFSIKIPPRGRYNVVFKYIGYDAFTTQISVEGEEVNLGKVLLTQNANNLKTAIVEGKITPVTQKNDTTEFNARAFKVNSDASAEDLIKKMPGMTQENGTIKSQGEEVKKVLVDGREFFGDDASLALKSLPAEVVDKIQVFDRMSDQSRFTGFDDGNSQKTINILTKPGMSNGQFGKIYAGYGTDNKYESGLNLNYFKGTRRLSLLGMSNNVNQQNFSSQDLLGVFGNSGQRRGGRLGGQGGGQSADPSNFLIGQQSGINKTTSSGINYSDIWGKKVAINASYFFNYADNVYKNDLSRQYFVGDGESQTYDEITDNNTKNLNHRFAFRMEYTIDSSNSLIFNPKFNLQNAKLDNLLLGATAVAGVNISQNITKNNSDNQAMSGSSMLLWMHKMKKEGRTISFQVNNDLSVSNNDAYLNSLNTFRNQTQLINQNGETQNQGLTNGLNISYTEPLGKKTQLQISYAPSVNNNNSNKNTYNYDSATAKYY
ncbi:MAG: carboxypeptidase-like regulatory domain-containing protein, partial [Lutibacter sp.]|nr:carboxypeptidase-like regulatory domain-containing protein [Lutibacter sp.]